MNIVTIDVHTDMSFDGLHHLFPRSRGGKARESPGPRPARPPATVNQRMLDMLDADPGRVAWSIRDWCAKLGCQVGSIHRASAWKRVMTVRAMERRPFREGEAA